MVLSVRMVNLVIGFGCARCGQRFGLERLKYPYRIVISNIALIYLLAVRIILVVGPLRRHVDMKMLLNGEHPSICRAGPAGSHWK